ncbi:MAG: hypothetical protein LBJ09_02495 [Clostridiales bacterium]|jgi:hypothetical protein|nr:hypothetical protein [Clostridiales bacterium]
MASTFAFEHCFRFLFATKVLKSKSNSGKITRNDLFEENFPHVLNLLGISGGEFFRKYFVGEQIDFGSLYYDLIQKESPVIKLLYGDILWTIDFLLSKGFLKYSIDYYVNYFHFFIDFSDKGVGNIETLINFDLFVSDIEMKCSQSGINLDDFSHTSGIGTELTWLVYYRSLAACIYALTNHLEERDVLRLKSIVEYLEPNNSNDASKTILKILHKLDPNYELPPKVIETMLPEYQPMGPGGPSTYVPVRTYH